MPILVQEVVNRSLSALDAEGSDRYLFDQDFKPGIKYAQEWLTAAFNSGFSSNKLSGEVLRELVKIKVWQANDFSRVAINPTDIGHKFWTILAIYPNPVTYPFQQPVANAQKDKSIFMPNLSYRSGKSSTNRLTLEEWNNNALNVFAPGNNILLTSDTLNDYAYLDFGDYSSLSYNNPGTYEMEIRPSMANKFVAIAYLKRPNDINLITDSMEFPDSLISVVVEKVLNWVSVKQGDGTNLYNITEKDVQQLVSLLS